MLPQLCGVPLSLRLLGAPHGAVGWTLDLARRPGPLRSRSWRRPSGRVHRPRSLRHAANPEIRLGVVIARPRPLGTVVPGELVAEYRQRLDHARQAAGLQVQRTLAATIAEREPKKACPSTRACTLAVPTARSTVGRSVPPAGSAGKTKNTFASKRRPICGGCCKCTAAWARGRSTRSSSTSRSTSGTRIFPRCTMPCAGVSFRCGPTGSGFGGGGLGCLS